MTTEADNIFQSDKVSHSDELEAGTKLLHGQYEVVKLLGSGGFGITYLAQDSLGRSVVIKECFPNSCCRRTNNIVKARSRGHQVKYRSIVDHFMLEAKCLAKLKHPNIVGVHQFFEENGTAYMALDYIDGETLTHILEDGRRSLSPKQTKRLLIDVLEALAVVHEAGILHRDISPDNIMLGKDKKPHLIDFGAAHIKQVGNESKLSGLHVVNDGYSPQELYLEGSDKSPTADIYALAATFYHVITGEAPINSQARLSEFASTGEDPLVPLADMTKDYERSFTRAIDSALVILPKKRLQTAEEWLTQLGQRDDEMPPVDEEHIKDVVAGLIAASNAPPEKKEPPKAAKSKKVSEPLVLTTTMQPAPAEDDVLQLNIDDIIRDEFADLGEGLYVEDIVAKMIEEEDPVDQSDASDNSNFEDADGETRTAKPKKRGGRFSLMRLFFGRAKT